jgi:ubiquinone/menaquinone biosynthesis C-methylase UbiE
MPHIYNYPGANDKATYDLENAIADPSRRNESFMESLAPFDGAIVADIGAGGGYHACLYAQRASHVYAVEPAPLMLAQLYERVAASGLSNLSVIAAGAEDVPLRDGMVDVVHSRFAYFFGPEANGVRSCEPGIREAMRILKPGGYFFIIDNDLTTGQFAHFLSLYAYSKDKAAEMQDANDRFYASHGFDHTTVKSTWTAPDPGTLRQVVTMEFPSEAIDPIMSQIDGSELTYHYRIYYMQK